MLIIALGLRDETRASVFAPNRPANLLQIELITLIYSATEVRSIFPSPTQTDIVRSDAPRFYKSAIIARAQRNASQSIDPFHANTAKSADQSRSVIYNSTALVLVRFQTGATYGSGN